MIRVEELSLDLRGFSLDRVCLEIQDGELFVLMGPTGSGKTLLLETIAGLATPDSGRVHIDGRDVSALPPGGRGVSIVYQETALFPHLSVRRNIEFGCRYRSSTPPGEAGDRIPRHLIDLLGIGQLMDRGVRTLSGGEKRKVELARALATNPRVILLDEPLASLDPPFREGLRRELRSIQRETGKTFLMTTHDLTDLVAMADRAAVLREGGVEQAGSVSDLFDRPASPFVAGFLGMRNIFDAQLSEDGQVARAGDLEIRHATGLTGARRIGIPPEVVVLSTEPPAHSSVRNIFAAQVEEVYPRASLFDVRVSAGGVHIVSVVTRAALEELRIQPGVSLYASFKASSVHVF